MRGHVFYITNSAVPGHVRLLMSSLSPLGFKGPVGGCYSEAAFTFTVDGTSEGSETPPGPRGIKVYSVKG